MARLTIHTRSGEKLRIDVDDPMSSLPVTQFVGFIEGTELDQGLMLKLVDPSKTQPGGVTLLRLSEISHIHWRH